MSSKCFIKRLLKSLVWLSFLLPLILPTLSRAELRPHGRLFSNFYVPVKGSGSEQNLIQQAQGLSLELEPSFTENQSATFNLLGLAYSATADPRMPRQELDFREGYYRYSKNSWDFRAGRQIISLGKTDVITPTDFLIGHDFRRFTPETESRRIGADGVMLSFTPQEGASPFNLTAVWNLDFAKSKLLLPPGSTTANSQLLEVEDPPVTFENSEVLLKASWIQSSYDFSLKYFRGWNHTPQLTKGQVTGNFNPLVQIQPQFTKIQSLGFDTSLNLEQWVVRFETAYTRTSNDQASTALYQPSHLDAVLGLERSILENWRLQAQAVARYFPRYLDPNSETGAGLVDTTINRALAKANALVQAYDRSWKAGATLRIAYGSQEANWNPEIFVLSYPATDELFIRPRLLYRLTQSLQLDVGMDRYLGPKETVIGRYKPFSSYFLEARWLF